MLKPTSEIYNDYSLKISQVLTNDNLIRLYLIYLKADKIRSESGDKKSPVPYYLIGFLGRFIKDKTKLNQVIEDLFKPDSIFERLFSYLQILTNRYKKVYIETTKTEYNIMIKRAIDEQILDKQIETINEISMDNELKKYFESLY